MPATFKLYFNRTITIELNMWRRILLEIAFIVAILIAACLITFFHSNRFADTTKNFQKTREYVATRLDDLDVLTATNEHKRDKIKYHLAYSPIKKLSAEITKAVAKTLNLNGTIGYPSAQAMESKFNDKTTLAGIVYYGMSKDDVLPKKISIKIRFPSVFRTVEPSRIEDRLWITRCSGHLNKIEDKLSDDNPDLDIYLREGFLQLQHQIFLEWYRRFVHITKPEYGEPQVEMRFIHYNPNKYSCPVQSVINTHSIIYHFIFLLPFLNLIYKWSQHYEDNVNTHDWHYGYKFPTQCLSNFLVAFVHMLILGIIAWLLLFVNFKLVNTNNHKIAPIVYILFALIFCIIGLIVCAMIIARLFYCKVNAVLFGLCFWLANFAVFSIVIQREMGGPLLLFPFILFINNFLPYAVSYYETVSDQSTETEDTESLVIFLGAILNIVIHVAILICLIRKLPGYYMSPNILDFKSYDVPPITEKDRRFFLVARRPFWDKIEFAYDGSEEIMKMRQISVDYKKTVRKCVKNVSLRFYKGEIFVMLGHIGSGKATMLRIICGLKFPQRGSIQLLGKNFYEDLNRSRKVIDFRMAAFNCLPEYMTVKQIINFCVSTKLDENSDKKLNFEWVKWWEYLSPYIDSKNTLIRKLRYGQRRLVSLCCCLAAGTQVVVLNEPAQHLNSTESRAFWDILEREKATRVIIVATCSIDDTERIANRIGIFNMGLLEVCGTPFYLSSKFGSGVELVLLKKPEVQDLPITQFLQRYIPNIEPDNEIGDQLMYKISNSNLNLIQQMLIHLEKERKGLGIDNIRVMGSDVSDIYMKLVTSFRMHQQVIPDLAETFQYCVVSDVDRRNQQARAVFYKKYLRSPPLWWCVFILFGTLILGLLTGKLAKSVVLPTEKQFGLDLGYDERSNSRQFLPNTDNCGFIELQETQKARSLARNAASRLYNQKSFECFKGKYISHITNDKIKKSKGMGAVEVENKQALIVYASQEIFHSAPMALNLLHNLILQFAFPDDKSIMATIENHPFSPPLLFKINLVENHIKHMNQPLTLGAVLPVIISMFILPIVEENARNLRILQIIAGLRMDIYWIVTFGWDYIIYIMASVIFLLAIWIASNETFNIPEKFLIWFLIAIYGIANIWSTYFISMFFQRKVMRAFLVSVLLHLTFGLVLFVIFWDFFNHNETFFYIASISPGFALLDGISNIYAQSSEIRLCEEKCSFQKDCTRENMHEVVPQCKFYSYFQWSQPGVVQGITFMILEAILFFIMIFWLELQRKERKYYTSQNLKTMKSACYPFDDAEVADLRMKIADADMLKCKESAYFVDQLEENLPIKGEKLNTISFAIDKFASMGIFGTRMSSKSHLVRQLVGEIGFSFGEIYVRGLDIKFELNKIHSYIGYCPQHFGYLLHLTPAQMIRYMCMLRGVPFEVIDKKTKGIAQMLNMTPYMNKRIFRLTDEKRRKVSIAVSLVAFNKIIILDEPTYGLPATARREIWNILRCMRYCGNTIIFTTTDEVEAKVLADFIILFEKYEMLTIGSLQYTRYKYSRGFYLEVNLIRDGISAEEVERNLNKDIQNLTRFVKFLHERSTLQGCQGNWLKYYIPVDTIIYSYLYGALEKHKLRLNIFEYSIYQASTSTILQHIQDQRAYYRSRMTEQSIPSQQKRPSVYSRASDVYD